jgi:hypothetical protein
VQPLAYGKGQREQASVAVELDRLARGVYHHFAVVAATSVRLDGPFQLRIKVSVKIVRNFPKNIPAVQRQPSSSLENFAQLLSQAEPRPKKTSLYRTNAQAKHLSRFLGGQTLDVPQHEDCAE